MHMLGTDILRQASCQALQSFKPVQVHRQKRQEKRKDDVIREIYKEKLETYPSFPMAIDRHQLHTRPNRNYSLQIELMLLLQNSWMQYSPKLFCPIIWIPFLSKLCRPLLLHICVFNSSPPVTALAVLSITCKQDMSNTNLCIAS